MPWSEVNTFKGMGVMTNPHLGRVDEFNRRV